MGVVGVVGEHQFLCHGGLRLQCMIPSCFFIHLASTGIEYRYSRLQCWGGAWLPFAVETENKVVRGIVDISSM